MTPAATTVAFPPPGSKRDRRAGRSPRLVHPADEHLGVRPSGAIDSWRGRQEARTNRGTGVTTDNATEVMPITHSSRRDAASTVTDMSGGTSSDGRSLFFFPCGLVDGGFPGAGSEVLGAASEVAGGGRSRSGDRAASVAARGHPAVVDQRGCSRSSAKQRTSSRGSVPHAISIRIRALLTRTLPAEAYATVSALVRTRPSAAVVVLADRYSDGDLLDALRAGAVGYLDKDIKAARLPSVVLAAVAGEAIVPRRLVGQLTHEVLLRASEQIGARTPLRLTRRESEVLALMQDGLSTAGIAEQAAVRVARDGALPRHVSDAQVAGHRPRRSCERERSPLRRTLASLAERLWPESSRTARSLRIQINWEICHISPYALCPTVAVTGSRETRRPPDVATAPLSSRPHIAGR